MKRIGIAGLVFLVIGATSSCATGEKTESTEPVVAPIPHIDYEAVQHDLDLDVSPDWVGYREKRFDACRWKADLQNLRDCGRAYFVQIGVQLSCRPTEEAQNTLLEASDLTPVGTRNLRWQLGDASGRIRTDSGGFGLILAITSGSVKTQRLRISTGEDFLVMPAGQATQIVTPVSWCR